MSPANVCIPLFNTMLTRLSVERITNGDTPRAEMLFIILKSGFRFFRRILRTALLLIKKPVTHSALTSCEITVASAAPATPILNPNMKTGSRTMFMTAPIITESIPSFAAPCDIM